MTGRLSEAVGSSGDVLGDDGPLSFIGDCLLWIVHLIYSVLDSVLHSIGGIFRSIWNSFGSGFENAAATVWGHIRGGGIYVYESFESGLEYLLDSCDDNATCSSVARETKDFAVYWFEQFQEKIGFRALFICIAAAVVLYFFWSSIISCLLWCFKLVFVLFVRCLGFHPTGIQGGTIAALHMRGYGGLVPAGSSCATLQSIGATGYVEGIGSESGDFCKMLLVFSFVVLVLYFVVLLWL